MSEIDKHVTFSLKERIYVRSGQEIAEMLHISLEPNVVVRTFTSHLEIEGTIALQGEYMPHEIKETQEKSEDDKQKKYVQHIEKDAQNRMKFTHHFPISISTPIHRVKNVNDITVHVFSFDYELPSTNCILLEADIHINGIELETEQAKKENEPQEEMQKEQTKSEWKKSTEKEKRSETKERSSTGEEQTTEMTQKGSDVTEKLDNKEVQQKTTDKKQKEDDLPQQTEERPAEVSIEQTETVHEENPCEDQKEHEKSTESTYSETKKSDDGEIDIQLKESDKVEDDEDTKSITFLTELFSDMSEKREKITIYIAQEDDTIESIAKQYDMSPLDLIKVNRLEDDPIEKGQLIFVPKKKSTVK